MKYYLLLLMLFINPTKIFAQDLIDKGMVRTQLTVSTSRLFSMNESLFYLHGTAEGYLNKKYSISGEGYYYLGSISNQNQVKFNHSLFFGASRHFIKGNNDFYVGMQPGVSLTQIKKTDNNSATHTGVNPLFSSILGYNFFVNRFFHFFLQSRIVLGEHNTDIQINLSEFKFSAGLGFNFIKQK